NKVSMGEVKRRELKNPHLRALFSSDKIREMNSYLVSRLMYKANKRQLLQYVRKAEKHTISLGDIKKVARLVGKSEAAKFLIEYNDRLALAGEKQKQLFENPKVKRLRKHIYEINKQLKDYRSALSLFKSLDKRKFISERAFLMALREAGPSVMGWFKELDWRKKPFIVQYAVGENELIKNPYGNGDENITSTFPLDRCRNDVVDSIKLLGRDIAMERFRIKTACIDE
ncbi:MAG: hypothetical protein NTY48_06760, partial [Candidatus Diapherotrites archaeon]|nr:hypothetical protein [Candidatus Diapherotrites archaeon]